MTHLKSIKNNPRQTDRNTLRKNIRQQRRQLSDHQQYLHAIALTTSLIKQPVFRNAKRIAFYLAEDGEIDPFYLIEKAWHFKKQVYLPVLPPTGHSLVFAPFTPDTPLVANRFNIAEPNVHPKHWLSARQLNLILMPLVAFDEQGNRLGMGGGFYDHSLAFMKHRKQWHSPQLIGLAHELQKVDALPCESWDIPLNMIATEKTLYKGAK
jgi:5-formyltetrahydrofolate cyclo-ligase